MSTTIKSFIQGGIRLIHEHICEKDLPSKIGLCLHSLEPDKYQPFIDLIRFFQKANYRFTEPHEFLRTDHKAVFLSFDDNYRSWYTAIPLFEQLQVKATFYVNAAPLRDKAGQSAVRDYYNRLGHTGEPLPLNSSELLQLQKTGHTIGAHTYSHVRLSQIPRKKAFQEIQQGKETLEQILGTPVQHFAYPYGMRRDFTPALQKFCHQLGFSTVANATGGLQHAQHTPFDINRSVWHLDLPFTYNLRNLRIDGRYFERLTGRSAIG